MLSQLLVDLLRISAGAEDGDVGAWRAVVLATCDRYSDAERDRGFTELTRRGLITDNGSPSRGWLTLKGKQALIDIDAPKLPLTQITFDQFKHQSRRQYFQTLLQATRGNVKQTAALAGCNRTTVHHLLRRLELRPRDFKGV